MVLALLYPVAEAVTAAVPMPTPVTCGSVEGVVWPAAMVTGEVTVRTEVPALVSVMVVPPAGAGADKVIFRAVDCPTGTVTLDARVMDPSETTVTLPLPPI